MELLLWLALGAIAVAGTRWKRRTDEHVLRLLNRIEGLQRRVEAVEAEARKHRQDPPRPEIAPSVEATPPPLRRAEPPLPKPIPPPAPREARAPGLVQKLLGANTLVRTGVLVLFFGVAFLLKWVAERVTFPIETRLAAAAVGGLALVGLGWRLRRKRAGYALSLQGGGIGIFYITIYAAFRLYGLLPMPVALGLMLAIVAAAGVLAVLQDALALAVLGALGGFLAPVLTSTGGGNYSMLLAYYVVLNLGVLGLAFAKTWRPLNLLGFVFTFGLQLLALESAYSPAQLWSTGPFLWIFFALYLGIAVLYARHRSIELKHYVDGTIVFGTPLVVFGLQGMLLRETEHGLAVFAAGLAVLYAALAALLLRRSIVPSLRLLGEAFLAIGVTFATLAIPLYFDAQTTSALWALEGAAIVWVSVRQQRALGQAFGVALQGLAGAAFVLRNDFDVASALPVLNSNCLGYALLALAAIFAARQLSHVDAADGGWQRFASVALFGVGMGWLVAGSAAEIRAFVPPRLELTALIGAATAIAAFSLWLRNRLDWAVARWPAVALLPVLGVLAALQAISSAAHPAAHGGWLAWPLACGFLVWFLHRHAQDGKGMAAIEPVLHLLALVLGVTLLTVEAQWVVAQFIALPAAWQAAVRLALPALVLVVLLRAAEVAPEHALARHVRCHRWSAPVFAVVAWCGIFVVNVVSDGQTSLPYVPVLNPLDLACLWALYSLAQWRRHLGNFSSQSPADLAYVTGAIGLAAFAAANAALLRTLHHWAGTPYGGTMLQSDTVQSALTVFWTVLAVVGMVYATRRALRPLWLAGGLLLGVVVLKLFLFDLSALSGIERIVAFLGVGVLLLAIGYFSPVPPRNEEPA